MSDTTSILDLPTDPAGGNNNSNVNIQSSEMSKQLPPSMTLDQLTINQVQPAQHNCHQGILL